MNELARLWYCVVGNEQSGPFNLEKIQDLIAQGGIGHDTPVWSEGMAAWSPASGTALGPLLGEREEGPPPPPAIRPERGALPGNTLAAGNDQRAVEDVELPKASAGTAFPVEALRDPDENFWLNLVWAGSGIVLGIPLLFFLASPIAMLPLIILAALYGGFHWLSWKLAYAHIYGNSIEVTKDQYPQIHKIIVQACDFLQIERPTVLVHQGHGFFELLVAKKFTRRGLIIVTSNMLDEFANKPTSREFMMFIGRQLGHIKAGHFRYWFFKDVIGRAAVFFHAAWQRRCHYTADRIGLLAAGDLFAAEQALLIITAGAKIAPGTDYDEIEEQRTRLYDSIWTHIALIFSSRPYMLDRIIRLREFASGLGMKIPTAGAIPIDHTALRAMPILLIHGHDRMALLELKDLLHSKFPNVALKVMLTDHLGTMSMPEKFEKIAKDIRGAIALVTPDDIGAAVAKQDATSVRARQNVIMEIGFVWGRLGRDKCMLMTRGEIELPSDLSGIDLQKFEKSPNECVFEVHTFLDQLTRES